MNTESGIDISVIITVSEVRDDFAQIYEDVRASLARIQKRCEFIFVEHADSAHARERISSLRDSHPDEVRLLSLRSVFCESDALAAGFSSARGRVIMVLPVYFQVQPRELDKLIAPLERDFDLIAARRVKRTDALLNRFESAVFNGLVRRLIGIDIHDLGCGVLAMRKEVADSLDLYGDMFRFMPVLAHRQGYRIGEVKIAHLKRRKKSGVYAPGVYLRRLFDIITLFFIVKFTKKPLRFFGLTGATIFFFGTLVNFYLMIVKFLGNPLANRPLLIMGTLFMVLGIQLVSIGLIGELIIFIHARRLKEYRVEKIV